MKRLWRLNMNPQQVRDYLWYLVRFSVSKTSARVSKDGLEWPFCTVIWDKPPSAARVFKSSEGDLSSRGSCADWSTQG